jgi:hypothetical protein
MTFFVKLIVRTGFNLPYCPPNSLKAVIQFCSHKDCQITKISNPPQSKLFGFQCFFLNKIVIN